MLNDELKEKYAPLRNEIVDMNISMYFLTDKAKHLKAALQTDRELMLLVLTSFRYFENGLIMHLTNLDDEKSSEKCFHDARKDLERIKCDAKKLKKVKKDIKAFRKAINPLKTEHRNIRIAHLNLESREDILELDEFMLVDELKSLVDKANEIGDALWGKKIQVLFKMGGISTEGHLDFREGKRIYGPIHA